MSLLNIDKQKRLYRNQLHNTAGNIDFMTKLQQIDDFVNSSTWKKLKLTKEGHDIAYLLFKDILKQPLLFFDSAKSTDCGCDHSEGTVTNDDTNMWATLTDSQKAFILKVDREKKMGIYQYQGLIVSYFGSTFTTVSTSGTFTGIITGYSVVCPNVLISYNSLQNLYFFNVTLTNQPGTSVSTGETTSITGGVDGTYNINGTTTDDIFNGTVGNTAYETPYTTDVSGTIVY